jgi:hypothetical protein
MKTRLSGPKHRATVAPEKISSLIAIAIFLSECASPVVLLACFAIHQASNCETPLPYAPQLANSNIAYLHGLAHMAFTRITRLPALLLTDNIAGLA